MKTKLAILVMMIAIIGGGFAYSSASVGAEVNLNISPSKEALFAFEKPVTTNIYIDKKTSKIYDWKKVETQESSKLNQSDDKQENKDKKIHTSYQKYLKESRVSYEIKDVKSGLTIKNNSNNDAEKIKIRTIGGKIKFKNPPRGIRANSEVNIKAIEKVDAKEFLQMDESDAKVDFVINIESKGANAELRGSSKINVDVNEITETICREKPEQMDRKGGKIDYQ